MLLQLVGAAAGPDRPLGERLLVAAPVAIVVTAVVVLLRRCWDRNSLAGIGLTGLRSDFLGFLLGLVVVFGAGAGVLAVLSMIELAQWGGVDAGALLTFLLTNAIVALLWEAIPEEVSIRGYALTALRAAFGRTLATLLTIATFMLMPLIAMATGALFDILLRTGEVQLWLSPPGGDGPLVYYSMLAAFGLLLIYARDTTSVATLWTCNRCASGMADCQPNYARPRRRRTGGAGGGRRFYLPRRVHHARDHRLQPAGAASPAEQQRSGCCLRSLNRVLDRPPLTRWPSPCARGYCCGAVGARCGSIGEDEAGFTINEKRV